MMVGRIGRHSDTVFEAGELASLRDFLSAWPGVA